MIETIWLGALVVADSATPPYADEAREILLTLQSDRKKVEHVRPFGGGDAPTVRAGLPKAAGFSAEALRMALTEEGKIEIGYSDRSRKVTKRTVWPVDAEDLGPDGAMRAWCELREDFRTFRFDRITSVRLTGERMPVPRRVLAAFDEVRLLRMTGDEDW